MAKNMAGSYHRTTIYLTDEQWRWLSRLAAQARLDDLPLSASDVIRLAVTRLRDQLPDKELRKAKIAHVRNEAEQYPGALAAGCQGMSNRRRQL
jgi:hypothetical protein